MIRFFSKLENAREFLAKTAKHTSKKYYLTWTRHGINSAEYRVSTQEHIFKNSNYTLYESEKGLIKKNVKPFNFYRKWTQTT